MRNFASKLLGEGGVRIFSFALISLLAHQLGVADFGTYSLAVAFASLFLILVDFGLNPILTREIARQTDARITILRSATSMKFIGALLTLLSIHVFSRWNDFARTHLLLIDALGVVLVTYSVTDYMGTALAGKEEMGREAWLRTLCRAIISITGITVLFWTKSLTAVVVSMSVASLFSLGIGLGVLHRRFGGFPIGWDRQVVKRLVTSTAPLVGPVIFWTFYESQDLLLLKYFHVALDDISHFGSAIKIIDVLKVFPVLLVSSFFPALSRFSQTRESFLETTRSLLAYAFLFMLAITSGVFFTAPLLLALFYSAPFSAAAPLLRILLLAYMAMFFNHICLHVLIAKDCEKKLLTGALIAFGSNLAFNMWMIPRYGSPGACYALVASEFVYLVFQINVLLETIPGLMNPFRRTFG